MISDKASDTYPEKPCNKHPRRMWEWDGYGWVCIDCVLGSATQVEVLGMRWLNQTDLFVNSEEKDPDKRVVFRKVGWLGGTGRMYTLSENPTKTEPGSFSPMFIQISPE